MINPAAMVGLQNDPAIKAIKGIQQGLFKIVDLREEDRKRDIQEEKREYEQEKRRAQDYQRLSTTDAREIEKARSLLKSTQGGIMAALLGGTALLGGAAAASGFNLKQFLIDVRDKALQLLGLAGETIVPRGTEMDSDANGNPTTSNKDLDPAASTGNVDDLSAADGDDPGFSGLKSPEYMEVTSRVGPRWGRIHAGVDIAVPEGTPMTVWEPAVVSDKGYEASGYGHWVAFKTKKGEHLYAHMTKPSSHAVGTPLKRGSIIGYAGNTGGSRGSHLHWEFDPKMNVVGRPRKNPIDVLNSGYKASMPFLGKQTGGKVGGTDKGGKKGTITADMLSGASKERVGADAKFLRRVQEVSHSIGVNPADLLGLMASESSLNHQNVQPKSKATGLIQFLPSTAKELGTSTGALGKMNRVEQMDWVEKFLKAKTPKNPTKGHLYTSVYLPHFAKQPANYVLATKQGFTDKDGMKHPASWYADNAGLDMNKDGKITIEELGQRIDKKKAAFGIPSTLPTLKKQRGGVVGKQTGGVVGKQMGGRVSPSPMKLLNPTSDHNAPLIEQYTSNFFARQAEQIDGGTVIIVNNSSSGSGSQATVPQPPTAPSMSNDFAPLYTDFVQMYSHYCRGIKI